MLLAVDTSTRFLGVALYNGVRVLGETTWLSRNHHTIELAATVNTLLTRTGIGVEELRAAAIATGPGSFTGLRIGMAFLKGLVLSRKIPLIGIPTLDVLAYAQPVTDVNLAAVLEAGRERLAVEWYRAEAGEWISNCTAENLSYHTFLNQIRPPATICGELNEVISNAITERYEDVFLASPARSLRRPSFLAELGWKRLKSGRIDDPRTLKPIYLHHGDPIPEN
jgi:tRNA threonylcarbamoyladenosine biosynthesis protein TsaB